jgi:transmembrane sensor
MNPADDLPEPERGQWDVDAMWTRVRARTVDAPVVSRGGPRWPRVLAAAASLIVIVGSGALIGRARLLPPSSAAAPAGGQYGTSRGQYATIRLTDGSEVTLAPESRLTISPKFSEGAREISLDGEAIFSVRHDAAHPFRVRARGAIVEDIGTRFDLRAYPEDADVTVAVVEGSVSFGAAIAKPHSAPVVLGRGDVGMLDGPGRTSVRKDRRADGYLDWAIGKLSFNDRPLPEVLRTISRWYDLDLRVTDPRLARRLVTAGFSRRSPSEMLDALAIALDARVDRSGRVLTLTPR